MSAFSSVCCLQHMPISTRWVDIKGLEFSPLCSVVGFTMEFMEAESGLGKPCSFMFLTIA